MVAVRVATKSADVIVPEAAENSVVDAVFAVKALMNAEARVAPVAERLVVDAVRIVEVEI